MQNLKNRFLAFFVAAVLIASTGAATALLPSASAHSPAWNIPTIAYCNVAPNPIGVGQTVNVGFWLNQVPPDASGPYGDRWNGMMVKVTEPNGNTETLGPFSSDDTGGTHTDFTPSQTGTYTFQMTFPGQTLAGTNLAPTVSAATEAFIGDYYEPSTSATVTLTVQQQPVGGVSVAPIPTTYWQTPINALNVNNWYVLGGASLYTNGYSTSGGGMYNASSNYNPYTLAPMTSHILWTQPEAFGGVLGGQYGGTTTYGNYYSTSQYEKKFDQIVINGYLYYTVYPGSSTTPTANVCEDLYTGQVVWTDNAANLGGGSPAQSALTSAGLVTPFIYGQVLDYVTPNQYGGLAYLWTTGTLNGIVNTGTEFNMFDAKTGIYILSVVNGTSMTMTFDSSGNLIGYFLNNTAGSQVIDGPINPVTGPTRIVNTSTGPTLNEWNSTQAIEGAAWSASASGWEWRPPQNGLVPFSEGLMWRMPVASTYNGNAVPAYTTSPGGIRGLNSGVIVLAAYDFAGMNYYQGGWGIFSGYSMTTGQQLWVQNITMAPFTEDGNTGGGTAIGDGVWTIPSHQDGTIRGFSLNTGALLWSDNLSPFDPYDSTGGYFTNIAGDNLYLAGFGGDIWSINMLTGKINWYTNTTEIQGSAETNSPYGVWPLWGFSQGAIADGVLYLEEGHEYSPPLFLGAQQLAINCTTGKLIWSIDAFDVDSHPVVAYGIMTVLNAYDNQIYAYGQGPSKTTVTAPDPVTTVSQPIVIRGTVMDNSAGASQEAIAKAFPNGLPCVSDASMSQFMEAVYEQQPMPNNVTGVPVTVYVLDSNNNYREIGATTTTSSGMFTLTWTPDITGNYTVTAVFGGTQSYYESSAQTSFYVAPATGTPAPTASPVSGLATESTLMYIGATMIVIIIVIGAVLAVITLRKRP